MELAGATALVTGGADGIGGGITERLAAEGMRVVVADLDQDAGEAMAARTGGSFIRADIGTRAGVHAAVEAACRPPARLRVLVNNAGGVEDPCFPAAEPQKWEYRVERIDRDERGPLDQERLTALGAEGWLLAGVVNWPGAQPATYYYFVRAA